MRAASSFAVSPRNFWYLLNCLGDISPATSWRKVTHTPATVESARVATKKSKICSLGRSLTPSCARMPSPVMSSCAMPVAKPPIAVRPMKSSANGVNPAMPSLVSKPALRAMMYGKPPRLIPEPPSARMTREPRGRDAAKGAAAEGERARAPGATRMRLAREEVAMVAMVPRKVRRVKRRLGVELWLGAVTWPHHERAGSIMSSVWVNS